MESAFDGLDLDGGDSSVVIEYNPTLQFYGDAPSREDLDDALKMSQDDFNAMMEKYLKTYRRTSFG